MNGGRDKRVVWIYSHHTIIFVLIIALYHTRYLSQKHLIVGEG